MIQNRNIELTMDDGIKMSKDELCALGDALWNKAQEAHAQNKQNRQLFIKYRGRVLAQDGPIFWVYIHRDPKSEMFMTRDKNKQDELWQDLVKDAPDKVYSIGKRAWMYDVVKASQEARQAQSNKKVN